MWCLWRELRIASLPEWCCPPFLSTFCSQLRGGHLLFGPPLAVGNLVVLPGMDSQTWTLRSVSALTLDGLG